jgi:serine/threonine protein kinase
LGRILGEGEFGSVREVQEIHDKAGHDGLPRLLKASVDAASSYLLDSSLNRALFNYDDKDILSLPFATPDESAVDFEEAGVFLDIASGHERCENNSGKASETKQEANDGLAQVESLRKSRKVLKKRCWRDGKARYAVKQLRRDLLDMPDDNARDFRLGTVGAMDLAMEATLLASLSHPNICKLRGTAGTPGNPEFMLVLDRLYLTLDERIEEWREEQPRPSRLKQIMGVGSGLTLPKLRLPPIRRCVSEEDEAKLRRRRNRTYRVKSNADMVLRNGQLLHSLYAAYDVARAMRYLHENRIVFRDLKPQNIAFDIRGDVRIFDFGLAKELMEADRISFPDDFNATGMTGSRRWMAPEVYFSEAYGLSADVYSFGLLLWNLCYLQLPFGDGLSLKTHHAKVMVRGERPRRLRSRTVSEAMWQLMNTCWSSDRFERPSFDNICEALRAEISNLRYSLQTCVGLDVTSSTAREISSSFRIGKAPSPNSSFRQTIYSGHPNKTPNRYLGGSNQRAAASLENPVNVSIHYTTDYETPKTRQNRRGRRDRGRKILRDFKLRTSDTSDRSDYLNNKSLQSMIMALSSSQLSARNLRPSNGSTKRSSSASDERKHSGVFAFSDSLRSLVSRASP